MKGIKEVSCSYKYLACGCLALGFKNTEVFIDDFPTVRDFIRLLSCPCDFCDVWNGISSPSHHGYIHMERPSMNYLASTLLL